MEPTKSRVNTTTQQHPSAGVGTQELANRFGLTLRKARSWIRELPHIQLGRSRFTTEPWLAAWLVANLKNPPVVKNFDPLEAAIVERAAWAVGELVRQKKLAVLPPAESFHADQLSGSSPRAS